MLSEEIPEGESVAKFPCENLLAQHGERTLHGPFLLINLSQELCDEPPHAFV
jgi:hypothetical protein